MSQCEGWHTARVAPMGRYRGMTSMTRPQGGRRSNALLLDTGCAGSMPVHRKRASMTVSWSSDSRVPMSAPWVPPGSIKTNESVAAPRSNAPAVHGSYCPYTKISRSPSAATHCATSAITEESKVGLVPAGSTPSSGEGALWIKRSSICSVATAGKPSSSCAW